MEHWGSLGKLVFDIGVEDDLADMAKLLLLWISGDICDSKRAEA
jgi:hypothetical protein